MTPSDPASGRPYDLFIVGLSIYVLIALVVEGLLPISDGTRAILGTADTAVCVIFLADFMVNFMRAENKIRFMKWGWIDLLASIPAVDALRWGRAIRLVRLLRVLRAIRATHRLMEFVLARRAEAAVLAAALLSLMMAVISSILMLEFESKSPAANIKTSEDAIWWAWTTLTTVGYGDRFPVTTEGRVVAAALTVVGVGLFGTWTAFVATWLLASAKSNATKSSPPV